ncbi:MAG: primosomal protein N' [Candidatus Omnitrophota bacterium]
MPEKRYAQVVVGLPIKKSFNYEIPKELSEEISIGKRVRVPFGSRNIVGYVVGFSPEPEVNPIRENHQPKSAGFSNGVKNLKSILSVMDKDGPVLDEELLKLTRSIAEYYHSSWGEAIEAAIPGPLRKGKSKIRPKRKLIEDFYEPTKKHRLTNQQEAALKPILDSIHKRCGDIHLLYGITASGKTEVYLQAIESALEAGMSTIVLVPEISLTPQAIERFKSRFGKIVAVLHSGLLDSERRLEWEKLKQGSAKIAVGARSAIFAPLKDLGLIVVDEEHETSYKQQDSPRYNARETAIMRAKLAGATVILGSATPSIETYHKALSGEYKLSRLTERVEKRGLPRVNIVDMRQELLETKGVKIFSRVLEYAVSEALKKQGQVMLFLNRRGFSTFINCKKCGYVVKCKHCDVSLTYHFDTKKLNCHYCGYNTCFPEACPKCKSESIRLFGVGTQKVESETARLFPCANIGRMDADSMAKRGAYKDILTDFSRRKIDILIGTQMIAKGHHFPGVMLVGVISADTALNLPDFRASERTFNLLTQVAGRAGRGEQTARVIIQTYSPTHYAIKKSIDHNYTGFYEEEIAFRRDLNYPPFTHIVELKIRGKNEEKVVTFSQKLSADLTIAADGKPIEVIGPATEFISKVKGQFRWNILLKGREPRDICALVDGALDKIKGRSGLIVTVDVDPIGL